MLSQPRRRWQSPKVFGSKRGRYGLIGLMIGSEKLISGPISTFPSVCAVSQRQPLFELLEALAEALREHGTRWYLFGAQAVVVWGEPRMTADVDVTVELDPEQAPALVSVLETAGFDLRIRDVADFVARTRVLPFMHQATAIPVDVVLAGPGLEELFLERSRQVEMAGIEIPIISPEDLIVSKVLAGRTKDLEDVRGILGERHQTLDLEQIRETIDLLEQALGQSDLQPVFEAEVRRAIGS